MPSFSNISKARLISCDERLQIICMEAIAIMDFSILCGQRNEEDQNKAFENGNSKVQWPQSKHNRYPSQAVDIAPYPVDWEDTERFARLAGVMEAVAWKNGIKIKWGGDFKSIKDMPHFELI